MERAAEESVYERLRQLEDEEDVKTQEATAKLRAEVADLKRQLAKIPTMTANA